MQVGTLRDLGEGATLPFETENLPMLGGTAGEDLLPQFIRRGDLAGARMRRREAVSPIVFTQMLLAIGLLLVLADAVDEAIAHGDEEEAAEVIRVPKSPGGVAKAAEKVGPDRLKDVGRIEFTAHGIGKLPANRFAQVGLVFQEHLLDRRGIAAGQQGEEVIHGLIHELLREKPIGWSDLRKRAAGSFPLAAGDLTSRQRRGTGHGPEQHPCFVLVRNQSLAHVFEKSFHPKLEGRQVRAAKRG